MFKKLMAMIKSPKNRGEQSPEMGGQRWLKSYDIILANMEGSPSYPLSHQLTIGSEIGNIVIQDPSVSPRHATVLLQDEVISIMDHGSVAGTFVNGKKIPAGKFIILEDTDKISVGDLEVKIGVKTKATDKADLEPPHHEELEDEEIEDEDVDDDELDEEEDELVTEESKPEPSITKSRVYMQSPALAKSLANASKNQKKKKKISFSLPSYEATNSVLRIFALVTDLLLSFIILNVFRPFDDFRNFLNYIPTFIAEMGDFKWENLWLLATEEAGQVTEVLKEIYSLLSEFVDFLPLVMTFFLLRLVTTLIFGVSISEFMFGVRGNFNGVWARIGGVLRVIIGMVTGPFLIFDLPALASKRTFKEFITFTNTYVGSRVAMFFGFVFYIPILLLLLMVSPMFIGLEHVEPIPFTASVNQRVKAKPATGATEGTEAPVIQKKTLGSRYLAMSVSFDPANISFIPNFRFKGDKSKLNMKVQMEIFKRESERTVTLELFKTFDMKELLFLGLRGNFPIHEEFQKLYNFAYSADNTSRFFKVAENPREEELFGKQVVSFTEMVMGLGVETLPDFMITKTPFIKSLVDYRSSLLGLLEYKDITDLSVIKLGKILCLRASYVQQKPFDLIIPLIRGEGRIFKMTFDRSEGLNQVRNELYKYTLEDLSWGMPVQREKVEAFNSFEVIDLFTTDVDKGVITEDRAQALYGYYFEKSAEVIKVGKALEYELWKSAVQSVMNVIPYLRGATDSETQVDEVKAKLKSNFSDLFNALENKNKSFFGIQEVPTV